MKNALYLLVMISSFGFAQKIAVTADGLRDSEKTENTYLVIEVPDKSAKELYSNAVKYVNKTYKNPDEVVKGKVENDYLKIVTHATDFIKIKNSFDRIPFSVDYTYELSFKDGKVKYEIVAIEIYNSAGYKVLYTGPTFSYSIFNKKGELKRPEAKSDIENYFNNQITTIKDYLSGKLLEEKW